MKKLLLILSVSVIVISCNNGNKEKENIRYSQDSKEISSLKAVIQTYEDGDWQAYEKYYADTAQIFHNTTEGLSYKQAAETHKNNVADLSSYGFEDEEDDFEMVVTDDNETWVNYWGTWKGTIESNEKEIIIPVHLTARFIDGKIVREYGYWDNSEMMMAMQEMDSIMVDQDSLNKPKN
ncbi:nuclear transport factor 2 family protein [Christiangramia sp.]|uniref:nuclear transport factor 2 family protein n=1 Tax=Christiangramia sp. TaxID=1931228 RepID=UPI002624E67A|nr:nuclear transport factor 2 family protein [Christiangramia sp.]